MGTFLAVGVEELVIKPEMRDWSFTTPHCELLTLARHYTQSPFIRYYKSRPWGVG